MWRLAATAALQDNLWRHASASIEQPAVPEGGVQLDRCRVKPADVGQRPRPLTTGLRMVAVIVTVSVVSSTRRRPSTSSSAAYPPPKT